MEQTKDPSPLLKLPQLLRRLGGAVLLLSAATFALQQWDTWSPVERYALFLGFTIVLLGAGLFCTRMLDEAKGARTFFGIACAFLPAHCVQLGAMIYATFVGTPNIPSFFILPALSLTNLSLLMVVAIPILGAATFLGFSALVRKQAGTVSLIYLAANGALLLPTRDSNIIGLIGLIVLFGVALSELQWVRKEPLFREADGLFARGILYLPLLSLLLRALLHPSSLIFNSVGFFTVGYLLYRVELLGGNRTLSSICHWIAFPFLFFSVNGLTNLVNAEIVSLRFLGFLPVGIGYALLLSYLSLSLEDHRSRYQSVAASVIAASILFSLVLSDGGAVLSLLCFLLSIGMIIGAFLAERRGMLKLGTLTLGLSFLELNIEYAQILFRLSPWMTLGGAGLVLVLAGSYVERNISLLRARAQRLRKSVSAWRD